MEIPNRRSVMFGGALGAVAVAASHALSQTASAAEPQVPDGMNPQSELKEIRDLLSSDVSAFPTVGHDTFLSHFVTAIRFNQGERQGQLLTFTLEAAVQVVARSAPFIYKGPSENHRVDIAIPSQYTQEASISDADFEVRPPGFFTPGKENVWVQILDLDSKGQTSIGPVRILVGETLKREYPDLYLPSLGATQSYAAGGFPARLFFSPVAVLETSFGAFRTRAKVLAADRITSFPPLGSISISRPVPLDSVDALRAAIRSGPRGANSRTVEAALQPIAVIDGLSHPIDAVLHAA